MYTVSGLEDKIQKIVEAAIEAEVAELGWEGTCEDGFRIPSRPVDSGGINTLDGWVKVTYPDAKVYEYDNEVDYVEPVLDMAALYAKWQDEIPQNFERFEDTPDPEGFESTIGALARMATGLNGNGKFMSADGGFADGGDLGNLDLAGFLSGIDGDLSGFKGSAMEALYESYLFRLPTVIAGQQALVGWLGAAVAGEKDAWVRFEDDINAIADFAFEGFDTIAHGGGGGSPKTFFQVIGAVANAAATFFKHPAIKLGAQAINAIGTFTPPAPEPPPDPKYGTSVSEVHGSLLLALSDQSRAIADTERALADGIDDAIGTSTESPDFFDLAAPGSRPPFLDQGEGAQYFAPGEVVELTSQEMREAAAKLDEVGRILEATLPELSAVSSEWPWQRNATVGLGRAGHHPECVELRDQVEGLITRTARTAHEVAERMVVVSYDFDRTEDQVEQDLDRLRRHLNDPTPNELVPYGYGT